LISKSSGRHRRRAARCLERKERNQGKINETTIGVLKTTAMGGLFVLPPVLLFYLLLSEALNLIVALATPIAYLFPEGTFEKVEFPVILGLVLVLVCKLIRRLNNNKYKIQVLRTMKNRNR
jgi:hypothetical protein